MHRVTSCLETLIRPRLLVVAARHGLAEYNRAVLLPRLLGLPLGRKLPDAKEAIAQLMALERALEQARRHHDASWRAADHVAVITALLSEARSLEEPGCDMPPASVADLSVVSPARPLPLPLPRLARL